MRRRWLGTAALWVVVSVATAAPPEEIHWITDVKAAFAKAAAEKKVLMICINARDTPGEPMEPAAKGLREVVYKDPQVVARSRSFVCCFLTPEGSSQDYGELRMHFGIDGTIVSPQHIFSAPDHVPGTKPLVRKQYWPYGKGETAVKALLELMDRALAAQRVKAGMPDAPPAKGEADAGTPSGPGAAAAADRQGWIHKMIELVRSGDQLTRLEALDALRAHDQNGDCLRALVPLVAELDRRGDGIAVGDVVRALGVPGLDAASEAIHAVLDHKDVRVRGHAAVSLEYIGSAGSIEPLLARLKREKDEKIANHLCRALGRCGAKAGDDKARKKLASRVAPKKEDFPSYGPAIGLAYFEGDAKVARSIERQILKLGDIFMGGQYGKHALLRTLLVWCLSEIKDPKSAKFVRKKLLEPIVDEKAWGKESTVSFLDAVARKLEGQADTQDAIDAGVLGMLWHERGRELLDEYRTSRPAAAFAPKGEWGRRPPGEGDR